MSRYVALCLIAAVLMLAAPTVTPAFSTAELTISGRVWQDLDANSKLDAAEPPIIGFPVTLTGDKSGSRSTVTDQNGRYEFKDVLPDSYKVIVAIFDGGQPWVATYPLKLTAGNLASSLTVSTASYAGINFGLVNVASSFARFQGTVTINGQPADKPDVEAVINGRACSLRSGLLPAGSPGNSYSIAASTHAFAAGCARASETVSFRVNGQNAHETAAFSPALRTLNLTVGSAPVGVPAPTPAPAAAAAVGSAPGQAPATAATVGSAPAQAPAARPATGASGILPPNTGDAGLR